MSTTVPLAASTDAGSIGIDLSTIDFEQWRQDIATFVGELRGELRQLEALLDHSAGRAPTAPRKVDRTSASTPSREPERLAAASGADGRLAALKAQIARQLEEIRLNSATTADSATTVTQTHPEENGNETL